MCSFLGSITHRLKNEDPSHKLMILKAAGKLDEYVATVSPYELIHIFAIAINQGDPNILALTLTDSKHPHRFDKLVDGMSLFVIHDFPRQSLDTRGLVLVEIPVQVHIFKKGIGREKKTMMFTIWREGLTNRWFIVQDSLYEELK